MNIVCGVLNQTEGHVFIDGLDTRLKPKPPKQKLVSSRRIHRLYTDLTVDEYLTYCADLRLMDSSKIKAAVEEAKEKCQIAHFSSRLIKNLSGELPSACLVSRRPSFTSQSWW